MSSSQSSVSRSIRLRSLVGFRAFDNFDVRLLHIIFNRGRVSVIIFCRCHFVGFRFRFRLIRFRFRFLGFWRFCRFRSMLLIRSRILFLRHRRLLLTGLLLPRMVGAGVTYHLPRVTCHVSGPSNGVTWPPSGNPCPPPRRTGPRRSWGRRRRARVHGNSRAGTRTSGPWAGRS